VNVKAMKGNKKSNSRKEAQKAQITGLEEEGDCFISFCGF
jgi:hypothetical protein